MFSTASRSLALATAAVATAAVGVVPTSVAVAASWSTPVTIGAPHGGVGPVGLTSTSRLTVGWWRWQDGAGAGSRSGVAFATRPARAGSFGPERSRISAELISLDVQGYGAGRLIALSQVPGRGPVRQGRPNPPSVVRISRGSATGFGAPTTLARANLIGAAQLGMAPSGRGIVAFASYDPQKSSRAIVSAAVRLPSGHFARPQVISGRGQAHGVTVAIGRRGDMVVAFVRNKKVLARVRRPGHGWGSIQTLATANGPTQWTLRAAVSDAGSVQVLWHRRFISDRMDGASLQTRRMTPRAGRFSARTTIETTGASFPSALVAIPGRFAVGYTIADSTPGSRSTARVSLIKSNGRTRLDVAPPLGGVRDVRVAWSDRHGLFATMLQPTPDSNGDGIGLGAFLGPGVARFGPLEAVTPVERVQEVAPGFTRDGNPLAVWSAPPDGTDAGIPSDRLRRVVRTSTRTP